MLWGLVLVGGALGAGARFGVSLVLRQMGPVFPWPTLVVNILGSLLIGAVLVLADEHHRIGTPLRAFLAVGVLGGFTTFSSFSIETLRLWEQGRTELAIANALANVLLSLLAVIAGVALARSLR